MVETAVESFGGLDVLHNNATDSSLNAVDTDIVTLDMDVFDRLVAVNLKGSSWAASTRSLTCWRAVAARS